MINWMFFPKNKPLDDVSLRIVNTFTQISSSIDSATHQLKSDDVLAIVRPGLEAIGLLLKRASAPMTWWLFRFCMVLTGRLRNRMKQTGI